MTFENKIRRNITGTWKRSASSNFNLPREGMLSGAFYGASELQSEPDLGDSRSNYSGWNTLGFSASKVVNTATENRPYSIYALPLIAF